MDLIIHCLKEYRRHELLELPNGVPGKKKITRFLFTARTGRRLHLWLGVASLRFHRSDPFATWSRSIHVRERKKQRRRSARCSKLIRPLLQTSIFLFTRVLCIGEIFRETKHEMSLTWKHLAASTLRIPLLFHLLFIVFLSRLLINARSVSRG